MRHVSVILVDAGYSARLETKKVEKLSILGVICRRWGKSE
jgi:hypothetical protein